VYNGDPDALALLDELKNCYAELGRRSSLRTTEEVAGSEILIEILLSFASKPSKLFAWMSQHMFELFSDRMDAASLRHLLNVRLFIKLWCLSNTFPGLRDKRNISGTAGVV